jgi:DNA-binding transcriptional ArsR family regulator
MAMTLSVALLKRNLAGRPYSHILRVHSLFVAVSRSPLLPLFRSDTQLGVLTELFCGVDHELMISELAERLALPLSSVAREVHRLEGADVVRVRRRGRAQFVSPNRELPWAGPLTELLDRTTGPAAVLAEAFGPVKHVDGVWIYGSWAARYHGEAGAAPHDIDVLVVGTPSALAVSRAAQSAERRTRVPVNATTVAPQDWDQPERDSFLATIRRRPLVALTQHKESDA